MLDAKERPIGYRLGAKPASPDRIKIGARSQQVTSVGEPVFDLAKY